ncbi:TPA: SUMO1 sentrin specific peptidase 1, variant 2 [Trebouxia sp. C0004]
MKRTWAQSSVDPLAAGMSNLDIEAAAHAAQKRTRGASAAATDQQTCHNTQAPMTQEPPSGAEAVTQRGIVPEPQAAVDLESILGLAAMHNGWDAEEASPIKGQPIESDSEIDHVGLVRRKPSSMTAKGRAQAGNGALAEEPEVVTPEQAAQLVNPGRHQARIENNTKSIVLNNDAQVSLSNGLGQNSLTSSMPESSSIRYEPHPSNSNYRCIANQQHPTLARHPASASAQVMHSERMVAYTRDDNRSVHDEEEEPVSSHGVYAKHAVRLQMTACTTPQMKNVAMAGISRCSWLYQGSMMHAARAATADVSAVDWNYYKRRTARHLPVVASSSTKAGPVVQHPCYATGRQRTPKPKEGFWRTDAERLPHQSQVDRLGSRARQYLPSMEDVFTADRWVGVQPLASGDCIQYDARVPRDMSEEKFDELMSMGGVCDKFEQAAAAAEAAIEAEAEAVEDEDDDALRALFPQPSNGDDEVEEAGVMDATYGSDEVATSSMDALEDDIDAMEEMSSVVSRNMSGHVAGTSCQAMQAKQQRKNKFDSVIQHLLTRNSDERPGSQASTRVLPLWLDIRNAAVGPTAKKGGVRAHSDAVLVDFIDLHLQVLREDIWTLHGVGQPNPTVVYVHMVLLQERNNIMRDEKLGHPNCHFLGPDLLESIVTCDSNWDGVREWQEPLQLQDMCKRRSPSILDCDKLICVVPLEDSWVCVGIDLKHQVIKWYDSLLQEHDDEIVGTLVNWVQHESKQTLDLSKWEVKNPMDMALPAETNSYDSGVFALLFAEYASRDAVIDFTSEHIGASRIKMISDIVLKRVHIPCTS